MWTWSGSCVASVKVWLRNTWCLKSRDQMTWIIKATASSHQECLSHWTATAYTESDFDKNRNEKIKKACMWLTWAFD